MDKKNFVKLVDDCGVIQFVLTSSGKVSRVVGDIGKCDILEHVESFRHLRKLASTNKGWTLEVIRNVPEVRWWVR